jgi:hypothetical protein
MPGVPFPNSIVRGRAVWVAAAASALTALACHRGPSPASAPRPYAGTCGQRSAVALYRGRTPRRAAGRTGTLVVRIAAADSGLTPPEGPVRITRLLDRGTAASAAQVVAVSRQVGRSGPLPVGRYVVEATGTGYQPRRLTVSVRPGATDTVRFRLAAMCVRRASR